MCFSWPAQSAKDENGHEISLAKYMGKVTIVVNLASKCGYTKSNYEGLTELYNTYKDRGVECASVPHSPSATQIIANRLQYEDDIGFTFCLYPATLQLHAPSSSVQHALVPLLCAWQCRTVFEMSIICASHSCTETKTLAGSSHLLSMLSH